MYPHRFKIIFIIIVLLFVGIAVRLFQLQLLEGDKYKGISKSRRINTFPLEATRGTIFDRNGKVLAIDQHTFHISVQYKYLIYSYIVRNKKTLPRISEMGIHKKTNKSCGECHENQDLWLERISSLLEIPENQILERAEQIIDNVEKLKQGIEQKSGRATRIREETDYHPVASDVAWEKVIQIEIKHDIFPGVRIIPGPKRIYPERELAAHIVGYMGNLTENEWKESSNNWSNYILDSGGAETETVSLLYDGYDKNDSVGRAGIEASYEEELRGLRGKRFEETTSKKPQVEKVIVERPPVSGNDIYLTIDAQIQSSAEKSLGASRGTVVVMDPWTGEILAMASYPRFNPNTVNEDFNKLVKHPFKPFLNRAVQGALPPGSIFKVVTATAALDTNSISTQTSFDCRGFINYKNTILKCWSESGHGSVTIEDAIPYSCNVFFFETAKVTGGDSLYTWAKRFGIGEKTGIDLPYERSGNLPKMNSLASAMNVAIGQGALLTTPLQLARVYAAIANGGDLVRPHVVLKVTNNQGNTLHTSQTFPKQKISIEPSTLETLRTALQDVITRGTAKETGLAVYKVAGKTGTAETNRQKDNHAWFVGYAPYDAPKYCFAVLVEHTSGHGADVAGPIVKKLMSYLFPELNAAL
ncbi:MAG TPA: penicillin-binding protein 2 [Candidatus Brocadiaceae bacterium]